ncbi:MULTISPECIES: helix-turn-helix domain-containing protein [Paenibacillus]|uniref:helix-turn-helix domain-containing protein n=1 Tax=Paenibacillus TaxID=44249 RepID=UPI0022B874C7|nr:helix-turn-helix domain-containing protein [Paenibacillus caseinilyticus]MCZ8520163.1 helix-turn-helix domain-containing protein [Paenibacillus caseinilyticus]
MNLQEFGAYFAQLRLKSGYRSQRELADKVGLSNATINRIEAGAHKASPETLMQIAPHLKNVTYEELAEKMGYMSNHFSAIREIIQNSMDAQSPGAPKVDIEVDPGVEFIMRAKNDLSPEAYEQFLKMVKKMKKAFEEDDTN